MQLCQAQQTKLITVHLNVSYKNVESPRCVEVMTWEPPLHSLSRVLLITVGTSSFTREMVIFTLAGRLSLSPALAITMNTSSVVSLPSCTYCKQTNTHR